MYMLWVALLAIGFGSGVLGALLGLGGGLFLVPALTLLCGLPLRTAVGSSLLGVIATSAGVACVATRGRPADLELAMRLELATTAGAIFGSLLAGIMPVRLLYAVFAVVVVATAAFTVIKARVAASPPVDGPLAVQHWPAGLSVSALAGALSGLTGVGGGFLKVPVMYAVMHVPFATAAATSSFMVGITAATSAIVYFSRGDVRPFVASPVCLGVFAGAIVGTLVAPHVPVTPLRRLLVIILLVVAIEMAWKAMRGGL